MLAALLFPAATPAQEPTGMQAVAAIEQALVEAIAKAEKSVVAIARVRRDDADGPTELDVTSPDFIPNEFGTGVVVDKRGLILTNYHVLGDIAKNDYYVWTAHKPYRAKAKVEAADGWLDLAVLKVPADNLEPITFGDTKNLKKGQIVVALGNPYAIARDGEVSASWGIISNLQRSAPPKASGDPSDSGKGTLHHFGTLIQTDARLTLGTSGGALVNLKGEMIGLTSSLAAGAQFDKPAGFAIPVDDAFKKALETLKSGHKADFGLLGIRPEHLSLELRQRGVFGARAGDVMPGTPAARGGVNRGDVITHVNGVFIHDANGLMREVGKYPAETKIVLTVAQGLTERDRGKSVKKTVELSKKYLDFSRPSYASVEEPAWRGMKVDYATAMPRANLAEHSREIDEAGCVAVVEVERDSPAWKAGLRPWTIVTQVGNARVATPRQFRDAVAGKTGPVTLRVTTPDGGKPQRTVNP
jgi:S1-C subfamily serine protease